MALICVVLMAMLNIKFKYKLILNFVIMLVPYLGWIGFLIYYIGWGRHNKMDYKSPAKTASPEGSEPADKDNETTDK